MIVSVEDTPVKFTQRIIDLVKMRTGLDSELRRCTSDNINETLMEADKSGVWFAFVVWPRNVEPDTCALNFLRMSFMAESVGFEDQKVEQAVNLVREEYTRLQQLKMYGPPQQPYYIPPPQQQMMFAAPQQPPQMMGIPQNSVPTSTQGIMSQSQPQQQ